MDDTAYSDSRFNFPISIEGDVAARALPIVADETDCVFQCVGDVLLQFQELMQHRGLGNYHYRVEGLGGEDAPIQANVIFLT